MAPCNASAVIPVAADWGAGSESGDAGTTGWNAPVRCASKLLVNHSTDNTVDIVVHTCASLYVLQWTLCMTLHRLQPHYSSV